MEKTELKYLLPEKAEFTLMGKTYQLKKFSVDDVVWLDNKFPDASDRLKKGVLKDYLMIAMRLLSEEDKKDFIARDWTFIDEETGERTVSRIGGAALMQQMIGDIEEAKAIISAVAKSISDAYPEESAQVEKKTILQASQ